MKIGIAGCGGIGSNIAMHLIRSNIDNLKLIDFDKIEKSNLNRQFFFNNQIGEFKSKSLEKNLKKIYTDVKIESIIEKITTQNIHTLLEDCDIIIEAFDKKEFKTLLIETFKNKPIISANGIGGLSTDDIKVKKFGNITIVGDFYSDISTYKTYSSKVMLISCLMTNEIIKIIGDRDGKF
ncbi:sulfur carrier protein ThiS adenylyltransferase ThiF [uncultured Cetobacterium sp.]|uniref:sulfur carrier protein ThiS adenylyltransferase ThiF n=1 Tax=uncultured Cetobacterium sp. TaxID=527638 RepID=UPI002635E406|nr:sulfur carrier protein ThiS adenylyltransferase ThiF [uncultured Cetobacterium sp.]